MGIDYFSRLLRDRSERRTPAPLRSTALTNRTCVRVLLPCAAAAQHRFGHLTICGIRTRCVPQVPIPQYPLYSATLTLYGGKLVPYLLEERAGWGLNIGHLKEQILQVRCNKQGGAAPPPACVLHNGAGCTRLQRGKTAGVLGQVCSMHACMHAECVV